ncbi:MAG: hypothetical protein N3J91_03010 [Verrucomicrobiae bacterium]|nr:hypothetical protein [Verrucomicrobiae bacterium]
MRSLITVALMATFSPFVAAYALVLWKPDRWGDTLNPFAILFMAYLGMLTFPGLIPYVIALIATPLVMSAVAKQDFFRLASKRTLLLGALGAGMIAGLLVMAPAMVQSTKHNSLDLTLNWGFAGAVSGGLSLVVITLVYRRSLNSAPTPPHAGA